MHPAKRFARNTIYRLKEMAGLERSLVLSGRIAADLMRQKRSLGSLADVEFSVFSQWGEDGIIDWLVERLGLVDGTFVEFGTHDFRESNCRFLLVNRNWRGFIIDGDPANIAALRSDEISFKYDIEAVAAFITPDNIGSLIARSGFQSPLGILSVDLDGVDWWVLRAIGLEAEIVVVEYNDFFGSAPVTVPYRPDFSRSAAHWSNVYWGASLAAFCHLLEARGYVFVGTNSVGTNAFFAHKRHDTALQAALASRRTWPCRIRETRTSDGRAALKRYDAFAQAVADLPLVRVDTNETVRVADAIALGAKQEGRKAP